MYDATTNQKSSILCDKFRQGRLQIKENYQGYWYYNNKRINFPIRWNNYNVYTPKMVSSR